MSDTNLTKKYRREMIDFLETIKSEKSDDETLRMVNKIENALIITSEDEDIALLISKLCRKGIKDYNSFKEYDSLIKEEYRTGNLKYPLYSDDFDIEEVRKGGEYDEL